MTGKEVPGGSAPVGARADDPVRAALVDGRPAQPEPYLRGLAFAASRSIPYPRADPRDRDRLPRDTWQTATLPVGVRLEVAGDATAVRIRYATRTDRLGYRGAGAGTAFAAWTAGGKLGEAPAELGEGVCELPLDPAAERTVVHLPEGMQPVVLEVTGVGGEIRPARSQPRWVVYGDSIAEGWIASEPALAWPAVAGRTHGLDVVNLGYAGAARGEVVSAEQVASLPADLLTVSHGTNCWTRIPHSTRLFAAGLAAFLDVLRHAHAETPILVVSPVLRPDAEQEPNRLGATLADLRATMEQVVRERGDTRMRLVPGVSLITAAELGDGIHPDDAGHAAIASAVGPVARAMIDPRSAPPGEVAE